METLPARAGGEEGRATAALCEEGSLGPPVEVGPGPDTVGPVGALLLDRVYRGHFADRAGAICPACDESAMRQEEVPGVCKAEEFLETSVTDARI